MGPIRADYQKYALGAVMMVAAVDMMNYMITDKRDGKGLHIWENPEGKGFASRAWWNDPSYTVTNKNGDRRKIQGGKAYFRPLKSIYEVAEWQKDPVKKFTYKLAPALTALIRQISPSRYQQEYKGWPSMPDRAIDFMLDVGTPIQAGQVYQVWKGKKHPWGAVMPFFGMPTSKVKDKKKKKAKYQ